MEQGVDFVAVDMPAATPLTVHIMAAVAQAEREAISARTKAGLESIRHRIATEGYQPGRIAAGSHAAGNPNPTAKPDRIGDGCGGGERTPTRLAWPAIEGLAGRLSHPSSHR